MTTELLNIRDHTIGAGSTLRLGLSGTFFQLMESSSDVTVYFYRRESLIGTAVDVPAGFSLGPLAEDKGFDKVEVYSAAAQTVKLCFARGAADLKQIVGAVTISNTPAVTVDSITPPDVGTTSHFRHSASSALETIVTPAANTAGIRVTHISVGGYSDMERVMIKTSAPSAWNDSAAVTLAIGGPIGGNNAGDGCHREKEYIIPAGYGLYAQANGAASSTHVSIAYEVL